MKSNGNDTFSGNGADSETKLLEKACRDIVQHKYLYIMAIPGLLFYFIFHYGPMYGAIIAFKDYTPAGGILGSPWVGFANFVEFFGSMVFFQNIEKYHYPKRV